MYILSRNKKNNVYPCFSIEQWGLRGSTFYEAIVLCLTLCYFVLVFFSPFSIAITSLGEERANRSAFRTFVRFALVMFCLFPLPLGVWEGLRFVIAALPGLFSNLLLYRHVFVLGNCKKKLYEDH